MMDATEHVATPITAALVLCGGKSSRMGKSKAWLELDGRTFFEWVIRAVESVVDCIVVVAAENQELPPIAARYLTVRDPQPFEGPLGAIGWGLAALPETVQAAFITSCDVPLLRPSVVRLLFERLDGFDIAVPFVDGFHHPLCAAYRRGVGRTASDLFGLGNRRPIALFEMHKTSELTATELQFVDPDLRSFRNANTPQEFAELEAFCHADSGTHCDRQPGSA